MRAQTPKKILRVKLGHFHVTHAISIEYEAMCFCLFDCFFRANSVPKSVLSHPSHTSLEMHCLHVSLKIAPSAGAAIRGHTQAAALCGAHTGPRAHSARYCADV